MSWEMIAGIVGSIFAAFAGAAAATLLGFWSWRKQRWIERREGFGEQVLTQFYEARDIIRAARQPGSFGGEGDTRPPIEGETESEANYRNSVYVPAERLLKHNEFFARLEASKYRFIALFGQKEATPFDDIKKIRNRILISSGMLIRTYNEHRDREGNLPPSYKNWEQDIGWGLADNDPVAEEIEAVIAGIERVCKPMLENKGSRAFGHWCRR